MKIDYMITTWNRFEIPESYRNALLAFLKKNPSATGWQIYYWFSEQVDYDPTEERFEESDECATPDMNSGLATIEIYGDTGDLIYSNEAKQI